MFPTTSDGHLGGSGQRDPLNFHQRTAVTRILQELWWAGFRTFHHGDCTGFDQYAAERARDIGYYIIGHPPENDRYRAFFKSDEDRAPRPYLERNQAIVKEVERLFAAPSSGTAVIRSGTWSTIRRAKSKPIPVNVIKPEQDPSSASMWTGY